MMRMEYIPEDMLTTYKRDMSILTELRKNSTKPMQPGTTRIEGEPSVSDGYEN